MTTASKTENRYETIIVTFEKSIREIDQVFSDAPQVWGTSSLKEWIEGYETTRFTEIGECKAIITSEDNMNYVKEWLITHIPMVLVDELWEGDERQKVFKQ
jgi:hypothetical protein